MVGLGGLDKTRVDRRKCGVCKKRFAENESKTMRVGESFFRCSSCDNMGD